MTTLKRSDVLTQRDHIYTFLQRKGPGPNHPLELFSLHGALGAAEEPLGAPEPRYRKSVVRRGAYDLVAQIQPAPEAFTTSFTEGMPRKTAALIERLKKSGRRFSAHAIISQSADPEDYTDWESKEIIEGVLITSFTREEAEADENDLVNVTAEAQYASRVRVFPIYFGQEAGTEITTEVIDAAVYPEDDRDDLDEKEIYLLCRAPSTERFMVVYSKDGGRTWTVVQPSAAAVDSDPSALAVVGNYVIVTSASENCYFYTNRDNLGASAWAKVTDGFAANHGPTAIYAPAVGQIFMAAEGGYVYRLSIPGRAVESVEEGSLTVQNLNAIHGAGDTIIAVGASNALLFSATKGRTWTTKTGPAPAVDLNCVHVLDDERVWIGADQLYYSDDRADSFIEVTLTVANLDHVADIAVSRESESVMYVAVNTTDPAGMVLRSTDGGTEFEQKSILDLPENDGINALAVGGPNYVLAAGLNADGTDGIAVIATEAA